MHVSEVISRATGLWQEEGGLQVTSESRLSSSWPRSKEQCQREIDQAGHYSVLGVWVLMTWIFHFDQCMLSSEFVETNLESWSPWKKLMHSQVLAEPWLVNHFTGFCDFLHGIRVACGDMFPHEVGGCPLTYSSRWPELTVFHDTVHCSSWSSCRNIARIYKWINIPIPLCSLMAEQPLWVRQNGLSSPFLRWANWGSEKVE